MTRLSDSTENPDKKIKVYYNSACPVCNAGITRQKNLMSGCKVQWTDVHIEQNAPQEIGSEIEQVRERLHVVDTAGRVRIGIEAFEVIWRHSPREQWKAGLIALPGIKQAAAVLYNGFARLLYRWNRSKGRW